ncbi:thiamine phosphate synthase [Nocardioides humilatus]|uniref:Thiamine phosphate synthase n=1 Tax=Nocardioides humilatus TaxID=2607660 RepID=A0A5B1LP19_9ACTN|nr:thiamine phosphate synthase [Nocardioides humilatus]KAA1421347.1 thiamine phosphate synthase [Nocardioides humilatus]
MTPLLVLTDRAQLRLGRGLLRTISECVDAGLEAVVVREHDLAPERRQALVAGLAALPGLTVITSRIPDPAAHATHLAADQPRVDGRFGRSCHDRAQVARAAEGGASWATLSPYSTSVSKPGYGPPLPISEYDDLPLPTYALGGVTPANAAAAVEAGACGVAVMGEVMRSAEPARVVAALLGVLR